MVLHDEDTAEAAVAATAEVDAILVMAMVERVAGSENAQGGRE